MESERATLLERLQGRDQQLQELKNELEKSKSNMDHLREENTELRTKISEVQARIEEGREAAEEKLTLLNEAQQKLSDAFKALSAEALKSNNQSFLELAKLTLEKFQEGAKNHWKRSMGRFKKSRRREQRLTQVSQSRSSPSEQLRCSSKAKRQTS
jgi:DNA recombination protein RmuC